MPNIMLNITNPIKKKIAERDAKKVQCECGSEVTKQNLPRHRKTKKHQNYLLTLTQD